jgi:phospholipid transport system substrate-binding protein
MSRKLIGVAAIFAVVLLYPVYAPASTPLETVQAQINRVIEVLRDPALKAETSKEAKKERIWDLVNDIFDYKELSRRTLGRSWKKLTPEQQKEFTELFSLLLGSVYMDRVLAYEDEKVVFNKENMLSDTKAEVQSEIVTQTGTIPINYRMLLKDDQWKVYDVTVEGVSLVKNYRSQFRKILTNKPPEELLEILRKKVGKA